MQARSTTKATSQAPDKQQINNCTLLGKDPANNSGTSYLSIGSYDRRLQCFAAEMKVAGQKQRIEKGLLISWKAFAMQLALLTAQVTMKWSMKGGHDLGRLCLLKNMTALVGSLCNACLEWSGSCTCVSRCTYRMRIAIAGHRLQWSWADTQGHQAARKISSKLMIRLSWAVVCCYAAV